MTADGEIKEVINNWSLWIDGEFGEFTLGKTKHSPRILDERSFHIGIDKLLSDDGDLFGFVLVHYPSKFGFSKPYFMLNHFTTWGMDSESSSGVLNHPDSSWRCSKQ